MLHRAGLRTAGAGGRVDEALGPAVVPLPGGTDVLVFSVGISSSGIPDTWAATSVRPGVAFLPDLSQERVAWFTRLVTHSKRRGDIVVVSVHWGPNWGYDVASEDIAFAHALVDSGADVVHGHSSHHPRPLEVYRGHLILYGCGGFINDYEGIGGHEQYRDDLRLLYLATTDRDDGSLRELRVVPFQTRRMRLHRAARADVLWVCDLLRQLARGFTGDVEPNPDGEIVLRVR